MNYEHLSLKSLPPGTEDFNRGIKIYEDRFDAKMRIDEETIMRMMKSTEQDVKLITYGFYLDDQIIGFVLLSLYKKENFVYVAYMALDKEIHDYGAAKIFIRSIGDELSNLCDSFLLFEVEDDKTLERLYRSVGTGMLDFHHLMPVMDLSQERVPARVMCFPKMESLPKDRFLQCLQAFLAYEYAETITPSMSSAEAEAYKKYLESIYHEVKAILPESIKVL